MPSALRAKAELFDELVEQLAACEEELETLRASRPADSVWRSVATELAGALRPYAMFREQRNVDGRIVVDTTVPASALTAARSALDRLGDLVADESRQRAT